MDSESKLTTLEDLEAALAPLPVPVPGFGRFLIDALGAAEKARLIDAQEAAADENGNVTQQDNLEVLALVLSVALVDEAGHRPFDNERGRQVLERSPFLVPLARTAMVKNGLTVQQQEAELDAAKNGSSAPPGGR